jgi:GT2 family glycosyltransferase
MALLSGNFLAIHSVLVRRDAVEAAGRFDERLEYGEDYDLWLRVASTGAPFAFDPTVLCLYRVHPRNTSQWRILMLLGTLRVLEKVPTYAPLRTPEEIAVWDAYVSFLHARIRERVRKARSGGPAGAAG